MTNKNLDSEKFSIFDDEINSFAKEILEQEGLVVDIDFLKLTSGDDLDFQKDLITLFLNNAAKNIAKMEQSLTLTSNDIDSKTWYAAAHSLKGASSSVGAFPMSKMLEYAQNHHKDDSKNKIDILSDIKIELERVSKFINQEILKS